MKFILIFKSPFDHFDIKYYFLITSYENIILYTLISALLSKY